MAQVGESDSSLVESSKEILQKLLQGNVRGVCSRQLDSSLKSILPLSDSEAIAVAVTEATSLYVEEMKVLKDRLEVR